MTPTSRSVLKGVLIEVERERDISSNPGSPLQWTPSNWEPVKLLRPSAECRAQRTVQSKENPIAHIFRMQTREAVTQGEQILIARSTQWRQKQKGGRYSISGGWFLKGIAVDHVTSVVLLLVWAWNDHWGVHLRHLGISRLRDVGVDWLRISDGTWLRKCGIALLGNLGVVRLWNLWKAWLLNYGNKWFLRWRWRLAGLFHLLLLRLRGWSEGLFLLIWTHALKKAGPRDRKADLVV